jgi:hypothetical protein
MMSVIPHSVTFLVMMSVGLLIFTKSLSLIIASLLKVMAAPCRALPRLAPPCRALPCLDGNYCHRTNPLLKGLARFGSRALPCLAMPGHAMPRRALPR